MSLSMLVVVGVLPGEDWCPRRRDEPPSLCLFTLRARSPSMPTSRFDMRGLPHPVKTLAQKDKKSRTIKSNFLI